MNKARRLSAFAGLLAHPGVNLAYYGNQRQLEYDLIVAPGADPSVIQLAFEGVQRMRLDEHGDLVLRIAGGEIFQHRPVVYQETDGVKKDISGSYVIGRKNQVGFQIAGHDPSKPLVIDPVLSYSTYLGEGVGYGIAVDSAGSAYVTGQTDSISFPTVNAFQPMFAGPGGPYVGVFGDAFITKLNALGALAYSTYLGGSTGYFPDSGGDTGVGIAVDLAGNAYVVGSTSSTDFPTKNAFRPTFAGSFVAKLNAAGALDYSTYFPGETFGIAVDPAGSAYITGIDGVTTPGAFGADRPAGAFVTKFNPSGMTLDYSANLSGTRTNAATGFAIAVDSAGNACVTGETAALDFPVKNAYQSASRKDPSSPYATDAFVTKLNSTGTDLVYSTYLGSSGANETRGLGIAVDSAGSVYVTGITPDSSDFPTTPGAFQTSPGNSFVTKFDAQGVLIYSTYFGLGVQAFSIAVDSAGSTYVTGNLAVGNVPILNPFQTTIASGWVTKLNAAGSGLVYSSYLGGGNGASEGTSAIAVDASGNAYVTGVTDSTNFPVTIATGSFEAPYSVLVTKISVGPLYHLCLLYDPFKIAKSGSTIPIKLQLCDGNGSNLSSASIVLHAVSITKVSDSTSGSVSDSGNANPDGDFRYDGGGYIFNLSTKGLAAGTYLLNFMAGSDPSVYQAQFQVKS